MKENLSTENTLGDAMRTSLIQVGSAIYNVTGNFASLMTVTNKQTATMQGLAQSYDMSIERFNAWNGLAVQAGLSGKNVGDLIDEFSNKLVKLNALGQPSALSDVFGKLDIDKSMLEGMQAADQFEFIMERLGNLTDKQQASSLADSLFGGKASQLVTYISNTGSSLDGLLDKQRQYNLLTQEGASGATRYSHSFDNLTNVVGSGWAEVSGIIGGEFADDIDALGGSIGDLVRDNKPEIVAFLRDAVTAGKELMGALWGIGSTINHVVQAMGGWKTVGTAVASLMAGKMLVGLFSMAQTGLKLTRTIGFMRVAMAGFNVVMAANPIGLVATAVGLLVFAGIELYQNWTSVVTFFATTFTWFKTEFPATFGFLRTLFDWSPLGLIINHWGAITGFFSNFWADIGALFGSGWEVIKTLFAWTPLGMMMSSWSPISEFFTGLWEGITHVFTSKFAQIESIWQTVSGWASKLKFWEDDDVKSDVTHQVNHQSSIGRRASLDGSYSRAQMALSQSNYSTKGATVHQNVGDIKVYAAPGQNAQDVGNAVQSALRDYQFSALYDLPEAS